MAFSFLWTKPFWSRSQELLNVGAGARAKNLDAWSWNQSRSLKFEFRLHSPGLSTQKW